MNILKIFFSILIIFFSETIFYCCSNFFTENNKQINIHQKPKDKVKYYSYKIINTYPHDRTSFTQGLVFENGFLYEGTGLNGNSNLRKIELETGKVLQNFKLDYQYFGEGITIYKNKIIQLTWKSNIGFVYDKDSFQILQKFNYSTEGWGITHDEKNLIMSDGTSTLYFLNPENFKEVKKIKVHYNDIEVNNLNELEYINGEILANIWKSDHIIKINPDTGEITGWIDFKGISDLNDNKNEIDVLNGIAYDNINDRLFITGKFWSKLFEIKLVLI